MKIKTRKISGTDYITKMFAQHRAWTAAKNAMAKLDIQWIKDHCPASIGDVIPVEATEDGHTEFLIQDIHVDIEEDTTGVVDPKNVKYSILFSYTGLFRGDGLEDKKARTRLTMKEKEDGE